MKWHSLNTQKSNKTIASISQLCLFSLELKHRNMSFDAAGFFNVDGPLLYSVRTNYFSNLNFAGTFSRYISGIGYPTYPKARGKNMLEPFSNQNSSLVSAEYLFHFPCPLNFIIWIYFADGSRGRYVRDPRVTVQVSIYRLERFGPRREPLILYRNPLKNFVPTRESDFGNTILRLKNYFCSEKQTDFLSRLMSETLIIIKLINNDIDMIKSQIPHFQKETR